MNELRIEERTLSSAPLVILSGELTFDSAPDLRDILLAHTKAKRPHIVVMLGELQFMDTSGLATLIEARTKADAYGGTVILVALSPMIRQVFEIARVTGLFTIADDEQAALSAVGPGQ